MASENVANQEKRSKNALEGLKVVGKNTTKP
jgi:hypothetical protein